MSHFSRTWDGVHLEGCALEDPETMEIPPGETVPVHEIEDSRWAVIPEGDCTCPELMIERAVGAAEMRADGIKEHGL